MKKFAIVLTTLVLGASSVAFADHPAVTADPYAPSTIRDKRDFDDDGIRDRRGFRPRPHRWVILEDSAMLLRGRAVIDVSSQRRFTKLSLDAKSSLFVDKVLIVFGNGERQVVEVNKRLGNYSAPLMIDLAGNTRKIDKVMVLGRGTRFRSSFALKAI